MIVSEDIYHMDKERLEIALMRAKSLVKEITRLLRNKRKEKSNPAQDAAKK
jgi:hypothetical protein